MNRIQSILIFTPFLLSQCGGNSLKEVERQLAQEALAVEGVEFTIVAPGVRRVIDDEAGVVCYLKSGGGIDCMLVSETLLNPASVEGE